VLEAQGSVLTNKYARVIRAIVTYGGCEWADVVETLAIDRRQETVRRELCQCAAEFPAAR